MNNGVPFLINCIVQSSQQLDGRIDSGGEGQNLHAPPAILDPIINVL